ncbi:sulfatase-like hydrolase/transferase [Alicyclobacillus sp. ALC3]|uniref:sulfatase-like hydrolase/transferase n=1 Tax=Alicyclobacillus sp. ALC3 TaxID=2796143 RepID=UPI002379BFA8|nr:sulfatase-like hydrolase/transferase [Alicyclobacillus sp. ALC3]WDL97711.1 sulfatase-like hydrolase/transferase [Alicyclobacillus sp. ALC3]
MDKPFNFLVIVVDQERYPSGYDNDELRAWRRQSLSAQTFLREHGLEFQNHYAGATACSPSRGTLFTGQYPSLHGVSQTTGVAKEAFDDNMFWLDPNTVPTMGHYFRAAGYQTFYKGKWHVSDEDILIPGTHAALPSYDSTTGAPDPELEKLYEQANRLDKYGFDGWVGPEPHGKHPRNTGSSSGRGSQGRDEVYAGQVVELISQLDRAKQLTEDERDSAPWLIVASFINPHDIALFGAMTVDNPLFHFHADDVPHIPAPPTADEALDTKPSCQASYQSVYPQAFQPILDSDLYRRVYYSLQKRVDEQMMRVLEALENSSFYEDTIVVFTSDHGELLGAHGLHQKWHNAYEEAIHIPLVIHNPRLFPHARVTQLLTSHVDVLPTILGMAAIDVEAVQSGLQQRFNDVYSLVGRDLSGLVLYNEQPEPAPVYFMTDDEVARGLHQVNARGLFYESVQQPNHVESVIAVVRMGTRDVTWKYARYYDNPQFWSHPGIKDVYTELATSVDDEAEPSRSVIRIKTEAVPDEFEMYNLTDDPFEEKNLADPKYASAETNAIRETMSGLLREQSQMKRLVPTRMVPNRT